MTESDIHGLTARYGVGVQWQNGVFVWGFSGFGGVVRNPPPLSGTRKMMPLFCCDFINALPRFMND